MSILDFFKRTDPFLKVLKEYFAYISPGKQDGTLEKYYFFYNSIVKFFLSIDKPEIQLHEIKVKTMEEMRAWLHAEKHRTGEHVSRHIEHCRAAFEYAILMEKIKYNPISQIKNVREKVKEPVSLTVAEINKLQSARFTSFNRNLVVDLFLFQCYTGLSYIDLWLYKAEKDFVMIDGQKKEISFIYGKRGKNNKPYSVQMNEYAKAIHDQYGGGFPQITNQGYNKLLKKIAVNLNINKDLSTHNARKTYSTLRYNQGMSLPGLADEMGNTPMVLNKHYITNSRERIKRDIQELGQAAFMPQQPTKLVKKPIWTIL